MKQTIKATSIDRASEQLRSALAEARELLKNTTDPELIELGAYGIVLRRINQGEEGLYDPNNSGDMLILTLTSWD